MLGIFDFTYQILILLFEKFAGILKLLDLQSHILAFLLIGNHHIFNIRFLHSDYIHLLFMLEISFLGLVDIVDQPCIFRF